MEEVAGSELDPPHQLGDDERQDEDVVRRKDPERAAEIEAPDVDPAGGGHLRQQEIRDQEARDDEEDDERIDRYLRETGADGVRVVPLTGDASDRRYFRVIKADGRSFVLAAHTSPIEIARNPSSDGIRSPRIRDPAVVSETAMIAFERTRRE